MSLGRYRLRQRQLAPVRMIARRSWAGVLLIRAEVPAEALQLAGPEVRREERL